MYILDTGYFRTNAIKDVVCTVDIFDAAVKRLLGIIQRLVQVGSALFHISNAVLNIINQNLDLVGKFTYFIGDNGKSASLFSGTCGFDGSVQCQQICLIRDRGDTIGRFADSRKQIPTVFRKSDSFRQNAR